MRTILVLTVLLLLSACGQKGPLYLPEESLPEDSPPAESEQTEE